MNNKKNRRHRADICDSVFGAGTGDRLFWCHSADRQWIAFVLACLLVVFCVVFFWLAGRRNR